MPENKERVEELWAELKRFIQQNMPKNGSRDEARRITGEIERKWHGAWDDEVYERGYEAGEESGREAGYDAALEDAVPDAIEYEVREKVCEKCDKPWVAVHTPSILCKVNECNVYDCIEEVS